MLFFLVFAAGFERGKEDLLPLPLKEDSHSISKSKVGENLFTELFFDECAGMIR